MHEWANFDYHHANTTFYLQFYGTRVINAWMGKLWLSSCKHNLLSTILWDTRYKCMNGQTLITIMQTKPPILQFYGSRVTHEWANFDYHHANKTSYTTILWDTRYKCMNGQTFIIIMQTQPSIYNSVGHALRMNGQTLITIMQTKPSIYNSVGHMSC